MRKCATKAVVLLVSVIFTNGLNCRAQDSQLTRYQIESAFIYNFAKFIDWPTQSFADATSPMVIGVLGKNVFGSDLAKTIEGKSIRGHPLQFKLFTSVTEATNCQVLFISDSEQHHLRKIISTLTGSSVLTVSDTGNFTAAGGIITLEIINDRVRFEINNTAAKTAGLTISSKLLSLAIAVR